MFKLPRRFIGVFMVMLLIALTLAACGDSTATPAASGTTAVSATTAAATTVVTATTAATTVATATTAATTTTAATGATTVSGTTAAPTTIATGTTAAPTASATKAKACTTPAVSSTNGKTYLIGIAVQNTIPALQNAIQGTKDGLASCGFIEGKNVKYDLGNALGDIPSLVTIGKKFNDEKTDLIVAVGSAALTNMYNATKDNNIPIVFNGVTSPEVALPNVVKSNTEHGIVTGVQALPPVEDGLKLIQEIVPKAKNIGIVYNPTEVNAVVQVQLAQSVASKYGMTIITQTVNGSGDVLTATQALADKVDVFLSITDVTVVNALESVIKVASDSKKPLFGLDPTSGPRGVVAAIGFDYYDNGARSAAVVSQILDGKKSNTIDITPQPAGPLAINTKAASQMGVTIPASVVSRATATYTDITPPKK